MPLEDKPGQVINLKAISAAKHTWQVAPLKQGPKSVRPRIEYQNLNHNQPEKALSTVEAGKIGGDSIALLKLTLPNNSTSVQQPLYIKVDLQGEVIEISESDYAELTSPEPVENDPSEQFATPAPLEPTQ